MSTDSTNQTTALASQMGTFEDRVPVEDAPSTGRFSGRLNKQPDTTPTTGPRIEYLVGPAGLIYATSPDVCGLVVARPTMAELIAAIPIALMDMEDATRG